MVAVLSHDLYGLDIVEENLIWTVGRAGHVRVSKDGARTWQEVSNLRYGSVNEFSSFLDDQTGWAASNDKQLWATAIERLSLFPTSPTARQCASSMLTVGW